MLARGTWEYVYNGGVAGYGLRGLAGLYNEFGASTESTYLSWNAYNSGSLLNFAAGLVTPASYVNTYNTLQNRAENVMTTEYLNGSGSLWIAGQGLSSVVGDFSGYNNAYSAAFGVDRQTGALLSGTDRASLGFMALSQMAGTTAGLGATYNPGATFLPSSTTAGAAQLPDTLYHYTSAENVESIMQNGLGIEGRQVFTTPTGNLSPIQAQIDLALSPNRGYPNALIGINTATLRELGISPIAGPRNVLSTGNAAGGGTEIIFGQPIPPSALRIIPRSSP